MENTVQVLLIDHHSNRRIYLELELSMTAFELFTGLNNALGWGVDLQNSRSCYLSCENPTALLRGSHTLQEFGLRDGSTLQYIHH